jgi:hypothetical protein
MASQYDAAALSKRTLDAVEAFEKAMKAIGAEAQRTCPEHFDAEQWAFELKIYVEDLSSKNGSFIGTIDDADDKMREEEAEGGLEPGETYRPIHRSKFPYPRAAE